MQGRTAAAQHTGGGRGSKDGNVLSSLTFSVDTHFKFDSQYRQWNIVYDSGSYLVSCPLALELSTPLQVTAASFLLR